MNVKHTLKMCVVVLGAALCLQTSAVMAEIVTTDQIAPKSQLEADKLKIQTFVERTDVKERLADVVGSNRRQFLHHGWLGLSIVRILCPRLRLRPLGACVDD